MSQIDCGFSDPKAANTVMHIREQMEDETATFLDLYIRAKHGDMIPVLRTSMDKEIAEVDDVVDHLTGGVVKSLRELQGNEDAMKRYGQVLTEAFESLLRASDDPAAVLAEANESKMLLTAYKRQAYAIRGDTAAHRFFNGFFKLMGVKKEVWKHTPNLIRHFGPASKYYTDLAEVVNFANSYNTHVNSRLREMMDAVEASPTFKRFGISKEVFNKTFSMMDEMYSKQMDGSRLAQALETHGVEVEPEVVGDVWNEYLRFRDVHWSEVNHGMSREMVEKSIEGFLATDHGKAFAADLEANGQGNLIRNKALIEVSRPGSLLGNFKLLRNKFNAMYADTKSSMVGDDEAMDRYRASMKLVHKKVNEMPGLFGYIPGNHGEPVGLEVLYDMNATWREDSKANLTNLTSFVFHRTDDELYDSGDFLHTALTQVQATGIMFSESARILAYSKIKEQVDQHSDWFASSAPRRAVETGIKQYLSDLESIINYKSENDSIAFKTARRASSALGLIPASYLMFPGSAIKNTLAANYMMNMVMGSEHRMVAFEKAKSGGIGLALAIDDYADKYLLSTGIVREFETFTPPHGEGATRMDIAHSYLQKTADKMGEGIFAFIPGGMESSNLWRVLTNMKGSEERAREHIKGLIFNRISETPGIEDLLSVSAESLTKADRQKINNLIQLHSEKAQYDMLAALGDFSPTAKPFWTHTMGDTAETTGQVIAGSIAKFLYVFRHPTIVNTEAFLGTMSRLGAYWSDPVYRDSISPEMKKVYANISRTAGVGIAAACYELYRDAVRADHNSLQFGITETFNPFQDLREPMNMAYASIIAPMIGAPLSDEAYQEIKARNVAFILNLLGGKEISAVVKEESGMQGLLDNMKRGLDFPRLAVETIIYPEYTHGKINKLYEKQHELRGSLGSAISIDPLWLAERGIEMAFVSDPARPDLTASFRQQTLIKSIATMMGLSVWQNNPTVFKTQGSKEWDYYARNHANRVKANSQGRGRAAYVPKTIADYQLQTLAQGKTPRINPQRIITR